MKKFNHIFLGMLGTLLVLTSCNKQLDTQPHQQIDQSQALNTAKDVQITLVGAYNRMAQADLYGGGAFLYADLQATQTVINWQGTYQQLTQMVGQTVPVDNSFVNNTWAEAYQAINQTNNVLANLGIVGSGDKDRTQGEAEFIRGLTYFDLVRLFGRSWNDGDPTTNLGVPIVLTPTTSILPSSYVARATVSAVYEQVIADLKDAEAKLPTSNTFFANKYAASAILARVYLQKGDYADAAAEADAVISSGAFSLNSVYSAEFPNPGTHVDNTTEDIFAIQVTAQQGTNSLNTYYASADFSGRGDIIILDSFVAGFDQADTRLAVYNEDSGGILRCDKFDNVYGNVRIVRLAEMYLIRAEANFRLAATSSGVTPLSDVNVIRTRAGLTPLTTLTFANILTERTHELAFEGGFFLHDAKRLNGTPNPDGGTFNISIGALSSFSPKLVFPIPLLDINANPKLVQNPGY